MGRQIEKRSSLLDENSLQENGAISTDDYDTLKEIILAAYLAHVNLDSSDTILYQVAVKSQNSKKWFTTPELFDLNTLRASDLLEINDKYSTSLAKDLVVPILEKSHFFYCIALFNSYIISGPRLESKMKNFRNVTLKSDNEYSPEFDSQPNYSIINSGHGVVLLSTTMHMISQLVQLFAQIKAQNHSKIALIQNKLENLAPEDLDEWLEENFENQMRSLDTLGIRTGHQYKHFDPYSSDGDIDLPTNENYPDLSNFGHIFSDEEEQARFNISKLSIPASGLELSDQYRRVSLLGKRFSTCHGIDTSREWVSKEELAKYGPEVVMEMEKKYKSMSIGVDSVVDDGKENQNSMNRTPIIARSATFTGEECLDPVNISHDLKYKHSLLKQASILDAEDKITPGPQSIILADDTLDTLHRISTENSRNLSMVMTESFNELERTATKGVIDWSAKRKSVESAPPPSNPFKEIDDQNIKQYKKIVTLNSMTNGSKTINLDINDATISSSNDSSGSESALNGVENQNGAMCQQISKQQNGKPKKGIKRGSSARQSIKNMFSFKNRKNPVEVKVTNLDTIDVAQENNPSLAVPNGESSKKRKKSFKRLFSFDRR